jgi:DNA-binding IclR family transcriptional regulator
MLKESSKKFNMSTRPGAVYSMTGTASGRVFSAFLPDSIVKEAMNQEKREGPNSGRVGRHCYMSKVEIEQIRAQKWATVIDPPVSGISAYAAPVFDHSQQIVMAITIIGLDYFLEPKAQDLFIPELLKTAQSLSRQLGYT